MGRILRDQFKAIFFLHIVKIINFFIELSLMSFRA